MSADPRRGASWDEHGRPDAARAPSGAELLWANRHEVGAVPTQKRAPQPGSVTAEGGGTTTPTLGGGFWFSREQSPVAGEAAR